MLRQSASIISLLFALLFSYQIVYYFVSLFIREKEKKYDFRYHRYAVLICARNEEAVIADLLASINNQTYPKEYFRTFVMADNCTDRTAEVARENGAIVYTRHNEQLVGKGYALEKLLSDIEHDFGDTFERYMVFDADNILKEDYIEQMNISYCKGNRIIAGYINSKNYDSNWISAGYSLFLLKKNRYLNNARYLLGLSCAINGTGFLFDRELIGNWEYHTLTEDIELSVDQVCRHNRIAYCEKAVLYDEQPTSFRQSFYQRVRWAKGYLQVIRKYSFRLLKGIIAGDFCCYDMLNTIFSAYGLSVISILINIAELIIFFYLGMNIVPYIDAIIQSMVKAYVVVYAVGLLTTVTEWKNIKASSFNKIFYTFTFPIFLATYIPIAIYALFARVTWVPIKHSLSMKSQNM
ncbi:MAG: glycosyltransferase family 2 protein [Erysipelotrichaceae bacterium]|nr:glycosyltransferase family 2 protein [Erysipelotrichaceae bacterium]